jgi:hypothetical protein
MKRNVLILACIAGLIVLIFQISTLRNSETPVTQVPATQKTGATEVIQDSSAEVTPAPVVSVKGGPVTVVESGASFTMAPALEKPPGRVLTEAEVLGLRKQVSQ